MLKEMKEFRVLYDNEDEEYTVRRAGYRRTKDYLARCNLLSTCS